jgi:hypothetical protein
LREALNLRAGREDIFTGRGQKTHFRGVRHAESRPHFFLDFSTAYFH